MRLARAGFKPQWCTDAHPHATSCSSSSSSCASPSSPRCWSASGCAAPGAAPAQSQPGGATAAAQRQTPAAVSPVHVQCESRAVRLACTVHHAAAMPKGAPASSTGARGHRAAHADIGQQQALGRWHGSRRQQAHLSKLLIAGPHIAPPHRHVHAGDQLVAEVNGQLLPQRGQRLTALQHGLPVAAHLRQERVRLRGGSSASGGVGNAPHLVLLPTVEQQQMHSSKLAALLMLTRRPGCTSHGYSKVRNGRTPRAYSACSSSVVTAGRRASCRKICVQGGAGREERGGQGGRRPLKAAAAAVRRLLRRLARQSHGAVGFSGRRKAFQKSLGRLGANNPTLQVHQRRSRLATCLQQQGGWQVIDMQLGWSLQWGWVGLHTRALPIRQPTLRDSTALHPQLLHVAASRRAALLARSCTRAAVDAFGRLPDASNDHGVDTESSRLPR